MVTARHPGRTVTTEAIEHTWNFLSHRSHSPWTTPSDQPAARPTVAVWEKAPAPSSYLVIQRNLSSFWKSFNPDLDTPTPNDIFPGDGGLAEVRWRSAPGGTDNWETATEPSDDEDDEGLRRRHTFTSLRYCIHLVRNDRQHLRDTTQVPVAAWTSPFAESAGR